MSLQEQAQQGEKQRERSKVVDPLGAETEGENVNVPRSEAKTGQRKKGKSLEEMLKEQIEQGKEEAMKMDARMDTRSRYAENSLPRGRNYYRYQNQQKPSHPTGTTANHYGDNYRKTNYNRSQAYYHSKQDQQTFTGVETNVIDKDQLNWQQKKLFAEDSRYQNRQYSHNRGANVQERRKDAFTYENKRHAEQSHVRHQSTYEAKSRMRPKPIKKRNDLPEWADDIDESYSVPEGSTLNWQQQALVNRDESDPFLSLIRGENDYSRE